MDNEIVFRSKDNDSDSIRYGWDPDGMFRWVICGEVSHADIESANEIRNNLTETEYAELTASLPALTTAQFATAVIRRREEAGQPLPASCLAIGQAGGPMTSWLDSYRGPWPARIIEAYAPPGAALDVASTDEAREVAADLAARGITFNDT